jgi:ferredoxin
MSDTVGLAIRQHLVERSGSHNLDLERALDVVRSSQEQLNLDSIEYACGKVGGADEQGKAFRSALLALARKLPGASCLDDGTVSCGGRLYSERLGPSHGETIALSSRCFEGIAIASDATENGSPVHIVCRGAVTVCAAVKVEGGYRILSPSETAEAAFAMRAGTVLEIEPSVDVVAANVSHASIDAAITGRFTGRIRANAVVFDKLMNLTPRTVISGDYAISSMPCGYVRMASR